MIFINYTQDVLTKFIKNLNFIENKFLNDMTNLYFIVKTNDRFTHMRLQDITQGLYFPGKLRQKLYLTEEYIKEKKNIKKKLEINLKIKLITKEKTKMFFYFSDLKNIIKKKIEKKIIPIIFVSVPSLRMNYIPNLNENYFKYMYFNFFHVYKKA